MYKIERFLSEHGFALKVAYKSGCLVWQEHDEDGFFGDEISLYLGQDDEHKGWNFIINYPYYIIIDSRDRHGQEYIEQCKATLEEHMKSAMAFNKELLAIENPWEKE